MYPQSSTIGHTPPATYALLPSLHPLAEPAPGRKRLAPIHETSPTSSPLPTAQLPSPSSSPPPLKPRKKSKGNNALEPSFASLSLEQKPTTLGSDALAFGQQHLPPTITLLAPTPTDGALPVTPPLQQGEGHRVPSPPSASVDEGTLRAQWRRQEEDDVGLGLALDVDMDGTGVAGGRSGMEERRRAYPFPSAGTMLPQQQQTLYQPDLAPPRTVHTFYPFPTIPSSTPLSSPTRSDSSSKATPWSSRPEEEREDALREYMQERAKVESREARNEGEEGVGGDVGELAEGVGMDVDS
ncbi:hypothetical protein MNV49_004443 [Pseudohyphozyma bogoriensis]|nr:hypothetical protein MNV49_004443 [Pseudohyphozyma bogoriensis]